MGDDRDIKKTPEPISYFTHEEAMVRNERTIKRLIISLVISIFLMFFNNVVWLYAWMQYDYESSETQTVSIDGKEGNANYIGNDGSIVNGKDSNNYKETTKENKKK